MATYTVTMRRVYETVLQYEADSEKDALSKFEADSYKYAVELEQCCVTNEIVDINLDQ